jgi:murein DD-endopeptidase MepM/ murein hydrolase activator NlpD
MALTAEQRRNAQIIISVGRSLGASSRDLLIALMTAMQESSLRNLSGGDRDSVGLFQQRGGWGSFSQRHNPAFAARMFFTGGMRAGTPGLLDILNRNSMGLTYAAQKVQRSRYPTAYAKHETLARGLMGSAGGAVSTSGGLLRPVQGGTVSSGFGPRKGGGGISKNHHGLDIRATVGSSVYAAAAGRVVRVTTGGNYGTRIEISHEGKLFTLYAHLSQALVRPGQQVVAGQRIALSGGRRGAPGAGNSTGPHLHFEVRVGANSYGNARDPQGFLNGRTTPNAYLETTTMVPGQAPMEEEKDKFQSFTAQPYVYVNPIDLMGSTAAPVGEDPLQRFGAGTPMPKVSGEVVYGETELDRPADLKGVLI